MTSRGWTQALARAVSVAAGLACALALAGIGAGPASAATRSPVTWEGAAPGNGTIDLALPLNANLSGLERFATAVSTPGSPQYGDYEPIATLAKRFGAPAGDRARALDYLRAAGATGVKVDATGLFVDATMKVAQAQRLFGTSLSDYRSARTGRYMAPSAPTHIPAALRSSVTGVIGLDTEPVFGTSQAESDSDVKWVRHAATPASSGSETADQASDESGYPERTGTATGCAAATSQSGFTPNQYLTAYGYSPLQGEGLEGQGERVALIEIDGFKYSDLKAFASCFGLPIPQINGYGVGLKKPLAPGGESTLDLEVLDAAAPKLKEVDVYESKPSAVDVLRSLTAPLANGSSKPDVISASLGSCEPATLETIGDSGLRTVEGSLALAAASGISVLASSGDDGSSACLNASGQPLPVEAVSYPASSPFVTGVGGTNFSLNAANQIVSQDVWNDSPLVLAAGGGGVSQLFSRPSYQKGFVFIGHRVVPDVAMLADVAPGYEIYCSAKSDCLTDGQTSPWTQVGGTSAAAPLLAGGLALVDEGLRKAGRQDIGLANPLLYEIAHSAQAAGVISDVVTGSNDLGQSVVDKPFGCCSAEPGYDYASGLGSVNLTGLAAVAGTLVPKIVAVGLSVPSQHHPVASEHLLARVSCSGGCLLGAYAHLQLGRSKKTITEASSAYLLRKAGRKTIKIAFSRSTLTKLRGALLHRERVTATIYGAILDPAGTIEAQTRGRVLHISS